MPKNNNSNFKIGQVHIEFTEKKMTPYGRFALLAKFFENIGFKEATETAMLHYDVQKSKQ
jgi:hypothetical protein